MHAKVTLEGTDSGTRMTVVSTFSSAEQLEQMLEMGMEQGLQESVNQIDTVLTR